MRSPVIRAQFRFYAELNDFLLPERRFQAFQHPLAASDTVKHVIESLGVPHTEVDLILVNGQSVSFSHQLQEGDRVSIYPMFESLDIRPILRLRPEPLRNIRFVVDSNLGGLARHLRMLGFDSLYRNNFAGDEIARISSSEKRVLLTRDAELLKGRGITHGYYVRTTVPVEQVAEVLRRFDLGF